MQLGCKVREACATDGEGLGLFCLGDDFNIVTQMSDGRGWVNKVRFIVKMKCYPIVLKKSVDLCVDSKGPPRYIK